MVSQWSHLKAQALDLRTRGTSIRIIEKQLSIPRSTLSNWFKDLTLSAEQKTLLAERAKHGLVSARVAAVARHNSEKAKRIEAAKKYAETRLKQLPVSGPVLELALAMLYLGEGGKQEKGLVLGNSNPQILTFYMAALRTLHPISEDRFRFELHLRHDQVASTAVNYWSRTLGFSPGRFTRVYHDKRGKNKPSFPDYQGVCVVSYSDVAIQRRLMYLYERYCQTVIEKRA